MSQGRGTRSAVEEERGRDAGAQLLGWFGSGLSELLGRAGENKAGPRLSLGPERRRKGGGKGLGLRADF